MPIFVHIEDNTLNQNQEFLSEEARIFPCLFWCEEISENGCHLLCFYDEYYVITI